MKFRVVLFDAEKVEVKRAFWCHNGDVLGEIRS